MSNTDSTDVERENSLWEDEYGGMASDLIFFAYFIKGENDFPM